MKIVSWNVNGVRAIMKKDFQASIADLKPDVLCLQETKAPVSEVQKIGGLFDSYPYVYANESKVKKGYSGTALMAKEEPIRITYDMDIDEHDQEGRVITAEFDDFFLVTVYTPNSGRELVRLDYRQRWDEDFRKYVTKLSNEKQVVICGDLNVAHTDIDLANPKSNYNKSAGFTQQEIDGLDNLLEAGFIDTWREQHPEEVKYTYWNYMFNARARNKGWRIDYFLVSKKLMKAVASADIYNEYYGSDHCPVGITLKD